MTSTKSYVIAKRAVWEACQQVKANRGAAGIDDETIAMFDQNLSRNLYKLWNRMSSGSYLPPPVKQVEIPKAKGGTRKLGIPTVSDRIAQTVVKRAIEPILEPIFHPDSYGYRPGRSAKQAIVLAKVTRQSRFVPYNAPQSRSKHTAENMGSDLLRTGCVQAAIHRPSSFCEGTQSRPPASESALLIYTPAGLRKSGLSGGDRMAPVALIRVLEKSQCGPREWSPVG